MAVYSGLLTIAELGSHVREENKYSMNIPVICFIPCCSKKEDVGVESVRPYKWPPVELEATWSRLEAARSGMRHCIQPISKLTPALHLHTGNFYSVPRLKETAQRLIRDGLLRLFIVSAGY